MAEEKKKESFTEIIGVVAGLILFICMIFGMFIFLDWYRNGTPCQQYLRDATKFNYKGELTEIQKLYLNKYCDWKF